MRVLVNFATLKHGGGQNVAMNFLHAIEAARRTDAELFFLVARASEPHKYLQEHAGYHYAVAPRNAVSRVFYELFISWYYLRKFNVDIIYTYFGIGLFPKRYPQVSGSASSNLYFPEIDFWAGYRGFSRLKKTLVDRYRVFGLKRATAVVFENQLMEERGRTLYSIRHTAYIRPSIHTSDATEPLSVPCSSDRKVPRGLFLSGWHLNKNLMLIPPIAAELKRRRREFNFIVTAPRDNSRDHKRFWALVKHYKVEDMVVLTGPVAKNQLRSLYDQVDYVFLLSTLESFSNNILEAWSFGKPLIVADEPWARAACHDAAVYVRRQSVPELVEALLTFVDSEPTKTHTIERGRAALHRYPSIDQRLSLELDYLRHVLEHV